MVNKMEVIQYLKKIYGPKMNEREQKSIKGTLIDFLDIIIFSIFIFLSIHFIITYLFIIFFISSDSANLNEVIEKLTDIIEDQATSNDTLTMTNSTKDFQSTIDNYCEDISKTENDLYHFNLFEL